MALSRAQVDRVLRRDTDNSFCLVCGKQVGGCAAGIATSGLISCATRRCITILLFVFDYILCSVLSFYKKK